MHNYNDNNKKYKKYIKKYIDTHNITVLKYFLFEGRCGFV